MLETLRVRLCGLDNERDELDAKRVEIEKQIANIKAVINKMLPLCGLAASIDDLSTLGFTDAIRHVFLTSGEHGALGLASAWLSPKDVRDELAKRGLDLSPYENPMSSIYTILNRMKDNDEIEIRREGLNVFYKEIVKEVDEDDFSWTPDAENFIETSKPPKRNSR